MALRVRVSGVALMLACWATGIAFGQDKPIAIGNVPEVVIDAAKKAFPGGKFVSAEVRTINKVFVHYDLEIKLKNKTTVEGYFDAAGKLLRTGVPVVQADVPEAVITSFNKDYKEWHVTEVYKETDAETKAEYYSADIEKDGKDMEVDISPEGKIVKVQELKKDD